MPINIINYDMFLKKYTATETLHSGKIHEKNLDIINFEKKNKIVQYHINIYVCMSVCVS